MTSRAFLMGLLAPMIVAACSPPASGAAEGGAKAALSPAAQQTPPADFLRGCLIVAPEAGLLDQDLTAAGFASALAPQWQWEKQPGDAYILRQVRNDAVSQRQIKASYLLQRLSPAALRQYGQDYSVARCGPSAAVLSRIVDDGVELKLPQIYGLAMQVVVANYRKAEAAKAETRRAEQAPADAPSANPLSIDGPAPVATQMTGTTDPAEVRQP